FWERLSRGTGSRRRGRQSDGCLGNRILSLYICRSYGPAGSTLHLFGWGRLSSPASGIAPPQGSKDAGGRARTSFYATTFRSSLPSFWKARLGASRRQPI